MNLEPPPAAAKEPRDAKALDKYLHHCQRVIVDHLRENGWPVDDWIIRLERVKRGP